MTVFRWLTALVIALTTLAVGRWLLLVGQLDDLLGALVQNLLILPRLVGALLAVAGLHGGGVLGSSPGGGGLSFGWARWLPVVGLVVVAVWQGPSWAAALGDWRRARRPRLRRPAPARRPPTPQAPPEAPPAPAAPDFETLMRQVGRRSW